MTWTFYSLQTLWYQGEYFIVSWWPDSNIGISDTLTLNTRKDEITLYPQLKHLISTYDNITNVAAFWNETLNRWSLQEEVWMKVRRKKKVKTKLSYFLWKVSWLGEIPFCARVGNNVSIMFNEQKLKNHFHLLHEWVV